MTQIHAASAPADEKLYVVAVTSNPVPYESRTRLTQEFVGRMADNPAVHLTLVEHLFVNQRSKIVCPPGVNHITVRGSERSELWIKESLITAIGVPSLPPEAKKIAWIDADVDFQNPRWAELTLAALDRYAVVQPWSHCLDLGPNYEVVPNGSGVEVDRSFCAAWVDGDIARENEMRKASGKGDYSGSVKAGGPFRRHPGFAWAIRREVYERIGGLLDWLVTGSGDHYMSLAFAGSVPIDETLSPGWTRRLRRYQELCDRHVQRNIGYVPGLINHHWHGRKANRFYTSRFQIIRDSNFDPDVDLVRSPEGIYELSGDNWVLRDLLRAYLRKRNEDSVDTV